MSGQNKKIPASEMVAVLLAGGQSTRMKQADKCLIPLNSKPLLDHVIDRLSPQVQKLLLNVNGDPSRFSKYKLEIIPDIITGFSGPLAGIHATMCWTATHSPDTKWILSTATDTPFIPQDLSIKLREAIPEHSPSIIMAQSTDNIHPVCALWPTELKEELENALKNNIRKVRLWTEQYNVIKVDFPINTEGNIEFDPFFNINNPQDIEKAEIIIKTFHIE